MRRLLIAMVLVVGCGDETTDGPLAQTAWVSSLDGCGEALVFGAGDAYRWVHACGTSTYVEDGAYAVAGGRITLTPSASSCAAADIRSDVIDTDVRPGSGELVFGAQRFVKVATGPGLSPYAVIGCFDGGFTPRAIEPIR